MTEQEWLNERVRPQGMVWSFQGTSVTRTKTGRRKLRLFGCACCRLFWDHLWDDRLRQAVEVAEALADGRATKQHLDEARTAVEPLTADSYHATAGHGTRESTAASLVSGLTQTGAFDAAFAMTYYELPLAGYCGHEREANGTICNLLRDIFGNPFRPVAFAPGWRTDTAVTLARQMYESREFSAMPILADALQDAGCDEPAILDHCRAPGEHVRGCWVVDMVLGKE